MLYLEALVLTACLYLLRWCYDRPEHEEEAQQFSAVNPKLLKGHLSPFRWTWDSDKYIVSHKQPVFTPFHRRPLIPLIARGNTHAWQAVTGGSLILTGPVLVWWLTLMGAPHPLYGVLLYALLWGVFGMLVMCPVLVDAPGTLLSLVGAGYYLQTGDGIGLVLIALLAGTVKEHAPVFMALYAWSPLPLIGLLFTLYAEYRGTVRPTDADTIFALHHPFTHARRFRDRYTFHHVLVSPWGVLLPLAFIHPSWQLWVTLAVAYGQLLIASDVSRLYHAAFPVVILCALQVPGLDNWWPLLLLAQWINPWQKNQFEAQPITMDRLMENVKRHARA